MLFSIIPDAQAIIRKGGVYRQVKVISVTDLSTELTAQASLS